MIIEFETVTYGELKSFIAVLNEHESSCKDNKLTLDEVMNTPDLLDYLCEQAVEDEEKLAFSDPFEFWNNDGWCDFWRFRTTKH